MIHLLEFPCESQLCTWMEFSFVCVRFFFFFFWLEHLLLMELTQPAKCWLYGSPCFFVNLNEKGRGGRRTHTYTSVWILDLSLSQQCPGEDEDWVDVRCPGTLFP